MRWSSLSVLGEEPWSDCMTIATHIRTALAAHDDPAHAARSFLPRVPYSYYWSDAIRHRGREFWPSAWD